MTGFVKGWIALLTTSLLVSCGAGAPDSNEELPVLRYRLAVTVETPEGERQGSSVIEQRAGMSTVSGPLGGSSYELKGEAIAVDLPKGQTLFVLLTAPNDRDWAAYAIGNVADAWKKADQPPPLTRTGEIAEAHNEFSRLRTDRGIHPIRHGGRDPKTGNPYGYPWLVRFRDVRDPATVEQVDPDDLEKSFGRGYRLKAFTIQMTDDGVTGGIEKRLAWLGSVKGALVQPPRNQPIADAKLAEKIINSDFQQ